MNSTPGHTVRDNESGAALVLVIAIAGVLALLMTMLVALSVNGMRQARSDEDWNAALAAAYAGVDEYQSRLSADSSYYRYGNPASTFQTGGSRTDPPASNPAFDVSTGGSWADVAGSDGRSQFRYEVDNSAYQTNGRIRLRSTGKVGSETRTIVADLKQQGFIDFLYFTDYEVSDPAVASIATGSDCYKGGDASQPMLYAWEGRPTGSWSVRVGSVTTTYSCNDITFAKSDELAGPVHSNDTIRTCGSVFKGPVTTANKTPPLTVNSSGCTDPTFEDSGSPSYSGGLIGMPATNSELKKETRSDLTDSDVPRPGCLYTGPTQIQFFDNGTMNVKSPFTKYTRIGDAAATNALATAPAECGSISALKSPAGATIAVPANNVIYVQNVPSVTTDANYWPSSGTGANPAGFVCNANYGWTLGTSASGNLSGYPMANERPPASTTYGCRSGDIYVEGTFKGSATLAAENYIFVVGDVTYADADDDILGLVGNNAVWVWNPVECTRNCGSRSTTTIATGGRDARYANLLANDRTINGAILSVAHTFQVQSYNLAGTQGTLTVMGAIAQKYRGPVATGGTTIATGYAKKYIYDSRFKFKAPPKFLNPITTTYGVTTWVETAAVFGADGAAR